MISEIQMFLPSQNAAMMNRPSITPTHAATVGSGQYVMAVTAVRGKIDLTSFEDEFLQDNEVRQLMKKVTVSASSDLERHYPKYWAGRVEIRLADGQSYSEEVIIPKGESGNPMTTGEVEEKFLSLATPLLGDDKARSVMKEMRSLDSSESLEPLIEMLK
jgi:2-methylcitrate dehydratase PrpD